MLQYSGYIATLSPTGSHCSDVEVHMKFLKELAAFIIVFGPIAAGIALYVWFSTRRTKAYWNVLVGVHVQKSHTAVQ